MSEILIQNGRVIDPQSGLDEVTDLNDAMKETSACGLGMAAPLITESLVRYFPEAVRAHVSGEGR